MEIKDILGVGLVGTAILFFLKNTEVFAGQPQKQKLNVPARLGQWSKQVSDVAQKTNLPQALIYAIIERESAGDPDAFRQEASFASRGLMQISGPAARDMGYKGDLTGLMAPQINILYGTKYLKRLFDLFKADPYTVNRKWKEAVAAYNAGIGNIRRRGIINPDYVSFVLNHYNKYRE